MKNLWNDTQARAFVGDLAQRVYSSRLLGADSTLVMHGGGNTSVKSRVKDIFGEEEEVIFVKGSGWDLATIEAAGFSPCRMSHLTRLAKLASLSDTRMAVELRKSLTDPGAPSPSVEAILHAILPAKFVDHTHADALLAVTNTPGGEQRVREIYGDRLVVIPYVMPGFELARLCAELFPRHAGRDTVGMLLMSHGLFTFGNTARESYDRMIELVSCAEEFLARQGTGPLRPSDEDAAASKPSQASKLSQAEGPRPQRTEIAVLRRAASEAAGVPLIMQVSEDAEALAFARRSDLEHITQRGPATPDHVIRTKRIPLIGRDVDKYVADYRRYFAEHGNPSLTMLDPAPRVILDRQLGLATLGRSAKDARIAEDIYRHTMRIIVWANAVGGWRALPARDIFEVEYWDLEQAKLRKSGAPAAFAGEVALVTGAASGIGKACVASLLARGAAVIGLDIAEAVESFPKRPEFCGIQCDVTKEEEIERALEQGTRAFGGLDILILNAGVFPSSTPVAELSSAAWRGVMSINLDANLVLLRQSHPLLKLAPRGGRVVVIGSKNVGAPGPGAVAYSASKAALQQLARVAALEWGTDRIRINTLHPNAVFDTGVWTPEVLASRAASYGMSVDEYKTNNVLKVEVTSRDVAELAAELCGPLFAKTTGAQIPVDGGTVRII
jgi:rhamnose utilization protein RhaD (predicted bifunctional aldolase and dehydrogenase)/NAD(P)-dependent dehydrogenase (short-subunit alcohol dehydrogenase family)